MKLRIPSFVLCALFALGMSAQDQSKDVKLTVNGPEITVPEIFQNYNIRLKALENDDGETKITVDLGTNDNYYLFLFGHAYTEKDLKKHKPSIRFDKKYYGATSRELIICKGVQDDDIMQVEPSRNRILSFDGIRGSRTQVEIPLYVAKYKKKGFLRKEKYLIQQRIKIVLNVELIKAAKSDDDFERVSSATAELIDEIGQVTLCRNKKHKPSLEEQKAPWNDKIQEIKDEISDIKSRNGWRERSQEYQKYKDLIAKLDGIEFKTEICSKCGSVVPPPPHHCDYCNMSAKQVWQNLDRTFKKIDNRETKKSSAIGKVNAMHKAWTGGCPKLTKTLNADPSAKKNIENLYYDIINY